MLTLWLDDLPGKQVYLTTNPNQNLNRIEHGDFLVLIGGRFVNKIDEVLKVVDQVKERAGTRFLETVFIFKPKDSLWTLSTLSYRSNTLSTLVRCNISLNLIVRGFWSILFVFHPLRRSVGSHSVTKLFQVALKPKVTPHGIPFEFQCPFQFQEQKKFPTRSKGSNVWIFKVNLDLRKARIFRNRNVERKPVQDSDSERAL